MSRQPETPVRERARLVAPVRMASVNHVSRVRAAVAVAASSEERRAFDLINAERRRRGQQPLVWDGELTYMARVHSDNMARQNFFNHIDREGLDMSGRAGALGLRGWRALGENIAYNQGYDDPAAFAVERWMTSSKHRENILNGQFTHAGLGVARASDGRVFFTQVFMTR
ncbi:MAG TPA: CAP domain-containing protein [Pyrinomonadaceae bacterium]